MTPTARTLKHCRELGWQAGVVERHNTFSHKKHDLFGFIDVVALDGKQIIGIQATSGDNVAARVKKICDERRQEAIDWIASGGSILVWGWKRYAKPVNRRYWRVRSVVIDTDVLLSGTQLERRSDEA